MPSVKAASISDIAPGTGKCVTVNGAEIALFNAGGTFHAIDNLCPHAGGPLGEGDLAGTTVTCPWHGWQFDVASGACGLNPRAQAKTFSVTVQGSDVLVEI